MRMDFIENSKTRKLETEGSKITCYLPHEKTPKVIELESVQTTEHAEYYSRTSTHQDIRNSFSQGQLNNSWAPPSIVILDMVI